MIRIEDKEGNEIGRVSKDKLPIKIQDTNDTKKRSYFVKQGTKRDSGLFMNNQSIIILKELK